MSDNSLIERLEAIPDGTDFSDPSTYAQLLGYNDEQAAQPQEHAHKAETAQPSIAAPQAPATAENSAPAAAVEKEDGSNVTGVATRDGKHVIPYTVLDSTRQAKAAAEQRAQQLAELNVQLQAELRAVKEGQSTAQSAQHAAKAAELFTDEELAAAEDDFPLVAKLGKSYREMREQLAQVANTVQSAPAAHQPADNTSVQALIDQHPLLAQWQSRGGAAWQAAIERDNQLKADPQWSAKGIGDRFAEVQRQLADEFGVSMPSAAAPTQTPAPAAKASAAPAPKPQPVAASALPTLSDLSGAPATVADPSQGMTTGQMADYAMGMSMEELRRFAGLSY